jgi:hypothetical protein
MSGEKTPMLSGAIPSLETCMFKWEKLGRKRPHLKPFTEVGLHWAGLYYTKMDLTEAYVVAMGSYNSFQ